MSEIWFNVLYSFFTTLLITIPLIIFTDIEKKRLNYIICVIITYIIAYISPSISKQFGLLLLFINCILYLYIVFNNITYSIIMYILICFSICIADALIGFIFLIFFNLSYSELMDNSLIKLLINIPILLLTCVICIYVKRVIKKILNLYPNLLLDNNIKKILHLIFYVILLLYISYYIIFNIYFNKYYNSIPYITFIYTLSVLVISLILISVAYILINVINLSTKQEFIDKENKQLKDYTNMLENMSTDLRRFKHDYVNILYTLGEYINEKDIYGLQEFYNKELLPESNKIINRDKYISLVKNIKIMPLKALISSKILIAQSHSIETRIEIFEEIDEISIKTIDICRIIGIFLDNAIEASCLCKKKFIHLAAIKNDDNIIIVILNSCPIDSPPVYKLYEKDFSTKGENHGIGLKFVKDLINNSYKNILLNTSVNNGVFKQELIIKKEVISE